jgi:hypothetical protein
MRTEPQSDELSPHPHTLYLTNHFNIIFASMPWFSLWSFINNSDFHTTIFSHILFLNTTYSRYLILLDLITLLNSLDWFLKQNASRKLSMRTASISPLVPLYCIYLNYTIRWGKEVIEGDHIMLLASVICFHSFRPCSHAIFQSRTLTLCVLNL